MQWKIERSSRLSDRFNRWAIRRGFPLLAWLAPRAPRWWLFANARWIISLVMFLHAKPKRAIARNLARVMGEPEGSRAVRQAVRQMLYHFAFYWVDLFRFAQLAPEKRPRRGRWGRATRRARAAARRARGGGARVILITAHLGNWELGAVLAGQGGVPVSVIYVPDAFGDAEYFRSHLRSFARLEEIPIRPEARFASLPMLRAFSEGRIVALQGDRDFNDRGVRVPFFGADASFPAGPFLLARMTGARLWPVFIVYTPEYRFRVELGEPIEVARTTDRTGDVQAALTRWVAVLETAVRRWPTQWYNFHDFWSAPDCESAAPESAVVAHREPGTGERAVSRAPEVATAAGVLPWHGGRRSGGARSAAARAGSLGGRARLRQGALAPRARRGRAGAPIPRRRDRARVLRPRRGAARAARGSPTSRWCVARRSTSWRWPCRAVSPPRCMSTSPTPGRSRATSGAASFARTRSISCSARSRRTAGSPSPPTTSTTALKWRRCCAPRRASRSRDRRRMAGGSAHQLRGEVRRRGPPDPAPRGAAGGATHARPARRCRTARRRGRVGLRVLTSRSGVVASRGAMRRLLRLVPYLRRHRAAVASGIASILVAAALGLASPWLLGRAIDALLDSGRTELGAALARYALLLVGITAVQGVFNFLQRRILVAVSRDVEADLRNDYFAHLERLEPAYFQRMPLGDLMARSASDLGAVRMVCGPAIMYATHTVATAAGALAGMVWIDPPLTLVALASLPLVAGATRLFADRIHRLYERVQAELAKLSASAQENLAGVRVVRAFAQEAAEERRFALRNEEYAASNLRLARWQTAFFPALQMLVGLGFAAVLGFGGARVLAGRISLGELVTFHFFLAKLVWPMIATGWVVNLVQRGSASLARVAEVLDTEPAIADPPMPVGAPPESTAPIGGALALHGLDFRYRPELPLALAGVDVEIPAGALVGIVGRTGSGKTTLLSLVPRLLDPPPGTLFVDGRDVRTLPLSALRRAVAMVPQESFLFSASIAENVAIGRPESTRAEIELAAGRAGLDDDLAGFPRGLDTLVGERGVTLSGGQKQRVALARALLRDAPILLLDDALSAVDARTEVRILDSLRVARAGRTALVVAHRLSTVAGADLVLVLERGRIVERGTPAELVAQGGLYAELERLQRLEEELEASAVGVP